MMPRRALSTYRRGIGFVFQRFHPLPALTARDNVVAPLIQPTGNLDSVTGADVIDLLLELNTSYRVTLIVATHDPAIATRCGRTISMVDGRVVHDTV